MSEERVRELFGRSTVPGGPLDPEEAIRRGRRRRTIGLAGVAATAAAAVALAAVALTGPVPDERRAPLVGAPVPTAVVPACGDEGDPAAFLRSFMEARVRGSGAEDCLSAQALKTYRMETASTYPAPGDDPGPLCLYTCGDVRVVGYRVDPEQILAADANSFEAAITVVLEGPDGRRYEDADFVFVGPGENVSGEARPLVIRGVGSDL